MLSTSASVSPAVNQTAFGLCLPEHCWLGVKKDIACRAQANPEASTSPVPTTTSAGRVAGRGVWNLRNTSPAQTSNCRYKIVTSFAVNFSVLLSLLFPQSVVTSKNAGYFNSSFCYFLFHNFQLSQCQLFFHHKYPPVYQHQSPLFIIFVIQPSLVVILPQANFVLISSGSSAYSPFSSS